MTDEVAIRQEGTSNIALPWYDGGCSVVPIRTDGSKRPSVEWGPLQKERLAREQVESWWTPDSNRGSGVAVICGAISGNLEMLEIEGGWTDGESLAIIGEYCGAAGVRDVWEDLLLRGYAEWSPSGGIHVLYRIRDGAVPGNTKLAMTADKMPKTKAETRGEGGYVIVAPTGGQCHPSGQPWTTVAGEPGLIPYLTMAERDAIHAAIMSALDESPPPAPATPPVKRDVLLPATLDRPGDAFNASVEWPEILEPHGWRVAERRGQETLWVRPDKKRRDGHSASTGYANDADRMYVWSTSAGLPTEQPLSKFFVWTALNHGGDFRSATRELSRLGFGKQGVSSTSDWATTPASVVTVATTRTTDVDELGSVGEVPHENVNLMFTDSGNANRMRLALDDKFRFVPARGKWMMFVDGAWIVDHGAIALRNAIADKVYEFYLEARDQGDQKGMKHWTVCQSEARISSMAKMMRGHLNVYTMPEEFDSKPEILNLTNGTINLETGKFHEHNSLDLLTKKMNVGYDPAAEAPRWQQYLAEVLPDPEMRDFLQRAVGYTMTGEPVERALFVLHGPGGTGKSRFIETLTTLFGTYGTTAADSLFRSKRDQPSGVTNDLNDLKGARLASVSELDSGVRMDEALVKRLTGFDTITSRGLYEENQTWRPQCGIWLATNHHFRIQSDDNAIWKRIKVVPFTQEISSENEDPHILKKLLAERNGIFNWMMEGLQKYRERGLALPEGAQDALRKYKSEQDPVLQFMEEMLDEARLFQGDGKDDFIEKTHLFKLYVSWSKDQGELPLGKTRFNRRMESLGYEEFKRSRMFWRGLRSNPEYGIMGTM